ncbi:MAG: transposase [Crocinitomicaceae bacterium]
MSRAYKFHKPEAAYFVSFAVVEKLYVFEDHKYKQILLDCLSFCQKEKGMEIYAWVIMSNHLHLVFRSIGDQKPGLLLGDFKRFTSNAIVKAIKKILMKAIKKNGLTSFKKQLINLPTLITISFGNMTIIPLKFTVINLCHKK